MLHITNQTNVSIKGITTSGFQRGRRSHLKTPDDKKKLKHHEIDGLE